MAVDISIENNLLVITSTDETVYVTRSAGALRENGVDLFVKDSVYDNETKLGTFEEITISGVPAASKAAVVTFLSSFFVNAVAPGSGDMTKAVYDPAGKNEQLAADSEVIHKTGEEIVTGNKTFQGNQTFKGTTNDGSTNVLELKDIDGNVIEYVNTDGFRQVRYRDEYTSGRWTSAGGAAAPDEISVTIGGIATRSYSFDGNNTEESMSNHFEMAHDLPYNEINAGTLKIEIHTHFRPSTNNAGFVKWFFDWSYTPVDGAPIPMAVVSYRKEVLPNKLHYQFLAGEYLPVPPGGFGIGGVITFNTRRTPTDVGDTYPDDALFIKTALHVPTDGDGSRQMYVK